MLQGTSRIKYLRIPPTTHYYPQNPRDYVCQLGLTSLMNNYDNFTSLKGKSNIFFRNNLHYTCTFHHFPNLILLLWFKNEIFQFYKFIEWLFLTFKCCCKGIHTVIRKKITVWHCISDLMAVQIAIKSKKHCHQISIFENFFFKLPRSVTKWFHYMYTVFRNAFVSFYNMFGY